MTNTEEKKRVTISMAVVDNLNDVLTEADISISEGMGALVWLAALAAQQHGLTKEEFMQAAADLFDQIEAEEKRQAGSLN